MENNEVGESAKKLTRGEIAGILLERPTEFTVGRRKRRFCIYPATLGKSLLYAELMEEAGLAGSNAWFVAAISKGIREKRKACLRIAAVATLPGAECLSEDKVATRMHELRRLDDAGLASMLFLIIMSDMTDDVERHFGMDKEAERMRKVTETKGKDGNTLSFGARSLWGGMIDAACERYGWSYQYVLWGISLANLRLLLADQVRHVFLTDEERRAAGLPKDGTVIEEGDLKTLRDFVRSGNWN